MEKLARNCIAGNKVLYNTDKSEIKWSYFEWLETFRNERGLTLTHELNKKHMQWFRAKMNVRMAVETLSNSVADSMEFLMERGFEEFSDATATIEFVRIMNNTFDVMNSRRMTNANTFKSAINPQNQKFIFEYFDKAAEYLKTIEFMSTTTKKGVEVKELKKIISSEKKTSFKGFIINMISLKAIYEECVATGMLNCLPTYKQGIF